MRFSPTRTQSVAVLVTCTVAIILVVAFVRYRIRRRIDPDSADADIRQTDQLRWKARRPAMGALPPGRGFRP